jgi:ABC-2 type transport system permease protein
MMLLSIKGNDIRLVIVDRSGELSERVKESLSPQNLVEKAKEAAAKEFKEITASQEEKMKNDVRQFGASFLIEQYPDKEKAVDQVRTELSERIKANTLDAYVIIPPNYDSADAKIEYFARNPSDFVSRELIESGLNDAIRDQRLARANIDEAKLREINRPVAIGITKVSDKGEERDSGNGFMASFLLVLMLYLVLTIYGQLIMLAVIEEKETKIAEVLFSSARPFELLMGKLMGVGLAGLTQMAIWGVSILALTGVSLVGASAAMPLEMPKLGFGFVLYMLIFFLCGFFTFAAIFALIGAIVPSAQEVGSLAVIPVMLMLAGMFSVYPIVRDPNSTVSTVLSMVPFVSPMAMPARMMTEMPPFWQVGLSVVVNIVAILLLTWIAAKIYRVGMLMYGKKPTIPEILRWITQS